MRDSSPWLRRSVYEPPPTSPSSTWFFRATAIASSWITLAGYTFFTITLTAPEQDLKWAQDVLGALGGIALATGYAGGFIAFLFSRSPTFKLDNVLLPLLLSSVGGLFEFVLNYVLHQNIPVSGAYVYIPLVTACVSSLVLASTALFINTRVKISRAIEASHKRNQLEISPNQSMFLCNNTANTANHPPSTYPEPPLSAISASSIPFLSLSHAHAHNNQPFTPHPSAISPLSPPPLAAPLRHMTSTELHNTELELNIPENEAQRRQLLRLLIAKEQEGINNNASGTSSAAEQSGASSTYRIEWPIAGGTGEGEDSGSDEVLTDRQDHHQDQHADVGGGVGKQQQQHTAEVNLHFPRSSSPSPVSPVKSSDGDDRKWSWGSWRSLLGTTGTSRKQQQLQPEQMMESGAGAGPMVVAAAAAAAVRG